MTPTEATGASTLVEICRLCGVDFIHLTLVDSQPFLAAAFSIELKEVLWNA